MERRAQEKLEQEFLLQQVGLIYSFFSFYQPAEAPLAVSSASLFKPETRLGQFGLFDVPACFSGHKAALLLCCNHCLY